MDVFGRAYEYGINNMDRLIAALGEHLLLVVVPLAIGLLVGLPLGLLSARSQLAATVFINGFNGLRVIPSIAILFLAIPYFGLSFQSAAIALTLLVLPPILVSTEVAFRSVAPPVREAAVGVGMSPLEVMRQIEIPLALPIIVAGIKTATVEVIASATLAAFIGAGGLGDFIVLGFAQYDPAILLVGAIPVAVLALLSEISLGILQKRVQPPTQQR